MTFFELWLDGVKIIISFIPIGIGMVLLPLIFFFVFGLVEEDLFGSSMFADIFFHCKTYKEAWEKFKQKIRNKKRGGE